VARIIVMPQARRDVDAAIETLQLPADSWQRIAHSLRVLETFPLSGPKLEGRFAPNRFVLGPWRWMLLVYRYDEASDQVFLLAMFDARSSSSPLTTQNS
jgi:plasmid stabilization system protein ParE